jgi:hypothetical protein
MWLQETGCQCPLPKKTDGGKLCRLRTFLKHPGVPMRQLKEFAACLFLTVLIDSWRRLLFRAKGGLTHGMRGSDSLLRILCQQSAQHDQ